MPIDFPNTPTNGQTFTVGDKTWTYNSSTNQWLLSSVSPDSGTLTTKGDLLTRSSSALVRLPVGTNTHVLTADSNETSGLKWAASGSWTTFTPTFKFGSTAASVTSSYGGYTVVGKLVIIQAGFRGSGSQSSGNLSFTLPSGIEISELVAYQRTGHWYFYDLSAGIQYIGIPYINNTDGTQFLGFSISGSANNASDTQPFTWAGNDEAAIEIIGRLV